MELILIQDVDNLGYKDDLVTVKSGFGRNYLIPQKLAVIASESARKVRQENMKQKAYKEDRLKKEAADLAEKLKSTVIKVGAKVGESGKIFGSVNNIQVAEAIKAALGVDIDRKKITLPDDTIKTTGQYKAKVQLFKEVSVEVTFEVVEE